MVNVLDDLVQLARLGLAGRPQDVQRFVGRLIKQFAEAEPACAEKLTALLRQAPTPASPLRDFASPVPVDADSRLRLLKNEFPVAIDSEPIWLSAVAALLEQFVRERESESRLRQAGLTPSRSALFVGPPGVGKTLAAKWVARQLNRPLLTLDLAAVISSFLGRTGNNLRHVLDYAKSAPSVLLLDELDAIAKRRDDGEELGELKRLVTVLLQEIDDWPETGVLLAATNHPELLDRAVWRRFDLVVEFPAPDAAAIEKLVAEKLSAMAEPDKSAAWASAMSVAMAGKSFSDIDRELTRARRESITSNRPLDECLTATIQSLASHLPKKQRASLAQRLVDAGLSQRLSHELTGVSRDTIRKYRGNEREETR